VALTAKFIPPLPPPPAMLWATGLRHEDVAADRAAAAEAADADRHRRRIGVLGQRDAAADVQAAVAATAADALGEDARGFLAVRRQVRGGVDLDRARGAAIAAEAAETEDDGSVGHDAAADVNATVAAAAARALREDRSALVTVGRDAVAAGDGDLGGRSVAPAPAEAADADQQGVRFALLLLRVGDRAADVERAVAAAAADALRQDAV
jgi:hypothetical protein